MRITGGSAKGQTIQAPQSDTVRPTTDRVREAIFSMATAASFRWEKGLDLYAGSGALGIEALSRDMQWVDFVDQNNRCCRVIKQNLAKTGFIDQAHVYCCPVIKALSFLKEIYDIVFIDPPYTDTSLGEMMTLIASSSLVSTGSIILASHSSRSKLVTSYGEFVQIKEKRYGDTSISIYQKEGTL